MNPNPIRPTIEADLVLFNYFFYHPEGFLDAFKLGKLKEIIYRNFRSKKIKGSLYVDVTDDAVVGAVEYTRYVF
jgi:hypothetical protein